MGSASSWLRWSRFSAQRLAAMDAEAPPGRPPLVELRRAQLVPYVYQALKRSGDPRADGLKADALASSFMGAAREDAAGRVGALLDRAGVPHLVIKGIAMRRLLSDAAPERTVSDVDVLVAGGDRHQTYALLRRGGLASTTFERPTHQSLFYERTFVCRHRGLSTMIDVHHRLVPWPLIPRATERLIARRRSVGGMWVPWPLDCALIAAVHYAKEAPTEDVRDAFDGWLTILRLAATERATLVARARELGCLGAVHLLMRRIRWLCGEHEAISEVHRLVLAELTEAHRRLIDLTLRVEPAASHGSTQRALVADCWRHGLAYDGFVRAGLATGRVVAALSVDHAMIRATRRPR